MRRVALLAALGMLVTAAPAHATLLGVRGDSGRFENQTGQQSQINLRFIPWGLGLRNANHLDDAFARSGPIPMIAFGTTAHEGIEQIKPRGIARGDGDKFLLLLGRRIANFGTQIYIRPMAEMNGHWNPYCAFNANGTRRGEAYSVKNYKLAFRRIYLIVHGGPRVDINARLNEIGLPRLRTDNDLPVNDLARVVWNPQGFGSPNIPQNSANSYYPGNRYVDVVANDLYDINYRAAWEANAALFKSHPEKPYGIGEFGLWGIDDPAFIRKMASFVRNHNCVEIAVYYEAVRGSIFDLGNKPNSRRAYRRYMTPLGD